MVTRLIEIDTGDGSAKATLVLPQTVPVSMPGVILYMDAFGLRPALSAIAERISAEGYAVLVPDLFYRFGKYGPFDAKTAFAVEGSRAQLRTMMAGTTQAMTERDTAAFITALEKEGSTGPIAALGYCLGGARALTAAAGYPDRIVAAASFHGGNLASDHPDSPHLRAADIRARVYIGAAGGDGSFPPQQSARLVEAFRTAEIDFILENYVGMAHGWAVADHGVYDLVGAERHWKRLLGFLSETLKG